MSNPFVFMGKLHIKGIFPIILKGNDPKWWGQNTDRKNYVEYTYNKPISNYLHCSKHQTRAKEIE